MLSVNLDVSLKQKEILAGLKSRCSLCSLRSQVLPTARQRHERGSILIWKTVLKTLLILH